MSLSHLKAVHKELNKIRYSIDRFKSEESDFEKNRLLKMIDAELMDAIYNLEQLIEMTED